MDTPAEEKSSPLAFSRPRRAGHLFQGPFKGQLIEEARKLRATEEKLERRLLIP